MPVLLRLRLDEGYRFAANEGVARGSRIVPEEPNLREQQQGLDLAPRVVQLPVDAAGGARVDLGCVRVPTV